MSQENVEVVRAAIDAWNRGDWNAALKDAAPSFVFDFSRSIGPGRGVYSLDQMRRYFHELTEPWESLDLETHGLIDAGQHAVMLTTLHARGRDGIELHAHAAFVWTILDERVTHLCFLPRAKGSARSRRPVGIAPAIREYFWDHAEAL